MKQTAAITFLLAGLMFTLGCTKTAIEEISPGAESATSGVKSRCGSQELLLQSLAEDPGLADRMNRIEQFTAEFIKNPVSNFISGEDIIIPVWVNVLYSNNTENISDAQINTQIQVLNEDFAGTNHDVAKIPKLFQPVQAGNTHIKFVLAGVTRKFSSVTVWGLDDRMKRTQQGGIAATSPSTTLNIWSCDLGPYYLGFATFPGGNTSVDGVVLDDNAFGKRGSTNDPYDLGRTGTHEVGHWLNLYHIWGTRVCGDDLVDDTPVAERPNYGCPKYPTYGACSATVPMMTMNYMDYTEDACMFMFTAGQNLRMQATFQPRGGRETFAQ